jgi:HK97 family phage major capsid protein
LLKVTDAQGQPFAQYRAAFFSRGAAMSTDLMYETHRIARDIQSRTANLDHRLAKLIAPSNPGPTGERFFKLATAFLLRTKSDHARADQIERAVTAPAMTGTATWAAELTDTTVGGLLLSIAKQSTYASLASRTPSFVIGPSLQKVVVGGEILASFIGEGQAIGVSQGALSSQTLTPKKIACITVITDEIERSGANIEAMLRQLMSAGLAIALDSVFFGSAAASSAAPPGILNGISATPASAATPPPEALRADLQALIAALNAPVEPVFVMHPSRLIYATATLPGGFAYPLLASGALPPTRVVCVDSAALIAANEAEPRFSVSADATMHMDIAAGAISTAGTPNVVSAPTVSAFQGDLLALRTILHIAWVLRAGGVSYVDDVTW